MERKKGFSLIELLVVMLIIAILATIGVSAFMSSQKKGRDSKRKTDLAQMQRALESYINDYSTYPHSDTQGRIVGCGNNDTACQWGEAFFNSANDTVYLAQLPKDTVSGQQYYYEFLEPNGYRIYSRLENTSDPAIPETGQYSTLCGEGTGTYCNYVVTSENVSSPVAYSIPTCKATGASCTASGECCDNGNCCDGKCQSAACLKPDGESCSLAGECVGGNCCNGKCQSAACLKPNGETCSLASECVSGNCCDGKCQSAACCTPGVDCRCWSSNGTTCDPLCDKATYTKSNEAYPITCNCGNSSTACGCECVGSCWASSTYGSCRGKMCWGQCYYYNCTLQNYSFMYSGSGTCSTNGTGTCYKITNPQAYYTRAPCCGYDYTCGGCTPSGTGNVTFQTCSYIN